MAKTNQYQPVNNKEMTDAQEVRYTKEFKQADIAGGYRKPRVKATKKDS